ncbi:GNAT family N-acetyltransferase [Clostridium butyricum]|jgi:ribosomal protein S18 acetylase RimI-like enzyme|uniref:GNAT family N-acetyltransferase n=1 Tax=Clostridium butyricum TaxID=1492 RepID=A0A6L9ESC0_CLOBU|nr:GNAT family N-acetyltransferase [Clostridium butyricum]KQB78035.1 GNAT family acetyltransferase [Clostridium butyricum]MDB2152050.1 GNAT family N-acetyltransferase [Clostridium butyricum]MDU5102407.1 GNAT family N-acetyltransferase [Clostridium butyricum]NAS19463.1 GNAT family N-acetyltransferase [Clostridium butyricum]
MYSEYPIIRLRDRTDLNERASNWFHKKWGIPKKAYLSSIQESQNHCVNIPQWYIVLDKNEIIAGIGVIENDFHKRKDLYPNICAVYVEEEYRNYGIAKRMLDFVCNDVFHMGYDHVYLITDHTNFYEKCGWNFLCMVEENDGHMIRMYHFKYEH